MKRHDTEILNAETLNRFPRLSAAGAVLVGAFLLLGAASFCVHGRAEFSAAGPRRRIAAIACVVCLMALVALDHRAVLESTGR